ncbi:MAG TPA: flagellar basal-body MS-ring/collar protein FliF [Verrucomicrobiae bacterium]
MNPFNQIGALLSGIWKQLGVNQRISIVLAALAVAGALGGVVFWSSRIDYALLYGKLDDAEAGKVVAYLDETKIAHKTGQGGGAIYVPRDKVHLARMQLASRGIPRGEGVGFEIFDKPNFGISDFVQRANYLRAVQGELARTISQLDEIDSARVMIVMPENRLLVDNQKKPTASVFIRAKGQATLPPSAVNSIRFLVANAVEGLQANMVSVVDNRGNVLSENSENDSIGGLTSSQLAARRNLEQYLGKKAEGMLEAVLGPGQAVVRVSAEINLDSLVRTEEKFDPDGQVARSTTLTDETTDTSSASSSGGIPGITASLAIETNNAAPSNSSKMKKKVTNSQYEINKIVNNVTQLAGGVKRLSAAVLVAARFEGTGEARKLAARTPEELEKLRRIVQNALGIQVNGDTRKDEITLEEMPFTEPTVETAQQASTLQKKEFWWNQAQNFIYIGLAGVVLIIFWRLLKKTSATEIPAEFATMAQNTNGATSTRRGQFDASSMAGRGGGVGANQGVVTVDTLNQLVRENPANVTQALQNWLTQNSAN